MKKHAIIPVFISHRGCPNDCVFCNQKRITARSGDVTAADARRTIEEHLSTLEKMNLETVELAFFGGSFTGIALEEQCAFLSLAKEYKDAGRIDKIHLSTRPDYINREILDNLKAYGVDVIELGVQSFDEEVLALSGRGHDARVVFESSALIKDYGFTLGIQLMVGLPGDTLEKCIFSARQTVRIAPAIARIYPTVVLRDTALHDRMLAGLYTPLSEEEAVLRSKAMYEILDDAGINIIRVGLKSSDIMASETAFHPAFRQLVEGRIARERLEAGLGAELGALASGLGSLGALEALGALGVPWTLPPGQPGGLGDGLGAAAASEVLPPPAPGMSEVLFFSNEKCYNNMFGHKACNRAYFEAKYPQLRFRYAVDPTLKNNEYKVRLSSAEPVPENKKEIKNESSCNSYR